MHRVQKLMSNYGYCSRRRAEELIKLGKVKVNGKTISIGDKAGDNDNISVDGEIIAKQEKIYLMLNKPPGCVTALRDRHNRTIMEYIDIKEMVFPVGRLDKDTSGLILLTNDGDFSNNVMHPRYEVEKTYLVKIDKPVFNRDIRFIESGVKLEEFTTNPAKVSRQTSTILKVTIHEGKRHIIKRMFEKLGFNVVALKRLKIGGLEIGHLHPGKYRKLSVKDIEQIFIK